MEMTLQTLVILVAILIMAVMLIAVVTHLGSGSKSTLEDFFKTLSDGKVS